MLETAVLSPATQSATAQKECRLVVIWIDWYAYHLARFIGLHTNPELCGSVAGLELISGVGVHTGQRFREDLPADLPVETLFPGEDWHQAGQFRIAAKLWRRLDTLNPQVVLVPGYYNVPALAAALWARLHGRKSVLMTESTQADHPRSRIKEFAKSLLIRICFNWAIAGGKQHVRYLLALGFPAVRIARFYDVVDNSALYRESQKLRYTRAAASRVPAPYFLYVGRLAPEKNITTLLAAYVAYREKGGSCPLLLVGEGPERKVLEAQTATSSFATDIHFIGHKSSTELPFYYAFARCFVLPSTREPWGLVINEAMACGLPVIISNRCGCVEDLVVQGENGLIVDPYVTDDFTYALAFIEALPHEEWTRMSARSLDIVADYCPEAFGRQVALIADA